MLPPACLSVSLMVTVFSQMDTLINPDPGLWGLDSIYHLKVILTIPSHLKHASPSFPSPFCSSDIPSGPVAESLQGAAEPCFALCHAQTELSSQL